MSRIEEIAKKIAEDVNLREIIAKLIQYPGFDEAVFLIASGAVKRYIFEPSGRIIWIIVGGEHEYIVYDDVDYCSCMNFYINAIILGKIDACQHLIAKYLAESLKMYEEIKVDDALFDTFMGEWKSVLREV
ncbi:MAG: hypothetical protein QXL15_04585 [Candidatus Korarchaeota archaeon]